MPAHAVAAFDALVARRHDGEPVAYLVGRRAFWTLEVETTPAALIPRPETELLVEHALAAIPLRGGVRVADLGTGTGAVALAIASERPEALVVAVDRSAAALALAVRNRARTLAPARSHGVAGVREQGLAPPAAGDAAGRQTGGVAFVRADWLACFADAAFDVVVANPPYVACDDPHLGRGDLRFEPREALAAGRDGLDALRAIVAGAPRCLRAGGALLVEHGFDQGPSVRALFARAGFVDVRTVRDLAGSERVSAGRRGPAL
jgi:release factor glutamine methyltransferase